MCGAEAAGWCPRAIAGARTRAKGKTHEGQQDKIAKKKQGREEERRAGNR